MTYDDLMAQPDDGNLHEFVRGEIRCMPPPKGEHGDIEAAIVGPIDRYLYERALAAGWSVSQGRVARKRLVGYLASGEAGIRFSLPDDPDQVRGVDVLYLTPDQFIRLEAVLRDQYVPEVPALVVEVISPSETAVDVEEKLTDYLAGGARLVWLLFPKTRLVQVYRPDRTMTSLAAGALLDGGEVLPGFSAPVTSLFS